MHVLVERLVRDCMAQGAAIDPVGAFDDLAELDRLARAKDHPPYDVAAQLLDLPVTVGGANLYRLSWGAIEWIQECAAVWFADDPALANLSLAWAMAHSRQPEAFQAANSPRAAADSTRRWARGLACSMESLMLAVDRVNGGRKAEDEGRKADGAKAKQDRREGGAGALLLARLMQEFGQDEDYWLWRGPAERVKAAVDLLGIQAAALAKAGGRLAARDPDNWEQVAFNAWRKAVNAFKEKWLPKSHDPLLDAGSVKRALGVTYDSNGIEVGDCVDQQGRRIAKSNPAPCGTGKQKKS